MLQAALRGIYVCLNMLLYFFAGGYVGVLKTLLNYENSLLNNEKQKINIVFVFVEIIYNKLYTVLLLST